MIGGAHLRAWAGPLLVSFRNRQLMQVLGAGALAAIGSWMYVVALGVYAYRTAGAGAVGTLYFVRWFIAAPFSPVASVVVDRYSRLRVLWTTAIGRALVMAAATVVVAVGASVWYVAPFAIVNTALLTLLAPAELALLTTLAETPAQLTSANAVASAAYGSAAFVGPAIGGGLLALTSPSVVFGATAGTMVASALLLGRLRITEPASKAGSVGGGALEQIREGFRTVISLPALRIVTALVAVNTFVVGAFQVFVVVVALRTLKLGNGGVGLLLAALGVGAVLGALPAAGVVLRRPAVALGLFSALGGISVALVGVSAYLPLALVLVGIYGGVSSISDVADTTLSQRVTPAELTGRVFGVILGVVALSIGLGALVAPALIDALGVRWAVLATGLLVPAAIALTWRPLRVLDVEGVARPELVALLADDPIFSPLPGPTREQIARQLTKIEVPAGAVVFSKGDPGDRYYLIESGEVEVSIDAAQRRLLGRGKSFGEIALLRDTPRTATITTTAPTTLYALDRDTFLDAVRGEAQSLEAANAVVASRLG